MRLELTIKNQFIEAVELDMTGIILIDQRDKVVNEYAAYLRNRYYKDIMVSREWEIVLTINSKMNETDFNYTGEDC